MICGNTFTSNLKVIDLDLFKQGCMQGIAQYEYQLKLSSGLAIISS